MYYRVLCRYSHYIKLSHALRLSIFDLPRLEPLEPQRLCLFVPRTDNSGRNTPFTCGARSHNLSCIGGIPSSDTSGPSPSGNDVNLCLM